MILFSIKEVIFLTDKEALYVSVIAQYGNITKAAKKLFIAQPSLTQALHRIENSYGTPFFYRIRSGLQLTDAGRVYLEATNQMNQIYKNMESEIGKISGIKCGRINLGISVFLGGILLPDIMSIYSDKFPGITLNVTEASSSQLQELTANGKLDLSILHLPFRNYDLNYISLHKEAFYLAVSKDNPDYLKACARGNALPVINTKTMQRQNFIMHTANQRIRKVSNNICTIANVTPNIVFTTLNFETTLSLASKGIGAAFAPASYARFYSRYDPAFFRFPAKWKAEWELVAAYSKNLEIPTSCFELLKVFQEYISSTNEVFQ